MEHTLIIKTGAAGDVVRTTSLLNVLPGTVSWVTVSKNKSLLPGDTGLNILSLDEAFQSVRKTKFTRVISLEENIDCARLASETHSEELAGVYFDNDKINYTDSSAAWFDMSRISKLGLVKANKLKAENIAPYQSHVFKMIGKEFRGERYKIYTDDSVTASDRLMGIEKRSGTQWPDKQWSGYDQLVHRLEQEGVPVRLFKQRDNVRDYLRDVAKCSHIVSGDSLAMHVALAYNKTCSAIFNCTSPMEIYDYGILKRIVSPLLDKYFYASTLDKEVIESVSVGEVYNTIPVN